MPSARHRVGWLIGAAVLFTFAVWSLATSAALVLATVLASGSSGANATGAKPLRDLSVMVGVAAAVTGLLMIASAC